ncbi:hypothetical protein J2S09_001684 [Bacillus fengqiuensis]|nr:hypothetical protein [Bacillus fengqiuensis]
MNAQVRKGMLWIAGVILAFTAIKFLMNFFGGFFFYNAPLRHQPIGMGHGPGFGHHHFMHGPHHGGFHLMGWVVFLFLGVAAAVILWRWLKKKEANRSFQSSVMEASIINRAAHINTMNADVLDEWEENQTLKKENGKYGNF